MVAGAVFHREASEQNGEAAAGGAAPQQQPLLAGAQMPTELVLRAEYPQPTAAGEGWSAIDHGSHRDVENPTFLGSTPFSRKKEKVVVEAACIREAWRN